MMNWRFGLEHAMTNWRRRTRRLGFKADDSRGTWKQGIGLGAQGRLMSQSQANSIRCNLVLLYKTR
jgi:hypothetical protein